MEISDISDEDVDEVVQLWQRCDLLRSWNDPYRDIELARRTPTSSILVGKENGRIIASAVVGFEGHRGWVYYVSVHPDVQRQGFGRAIMLAAETWLRQRGAPKIHLQVRLSNWRYSASTTSLASSIRRLPCWENESDAQQCRSI